MAVRLVYAVAQAVRVPIVGIGGITGTDDALEFFLAGADAIQVGTANFVNPGTALAIVDGLAAYLESQRMSGLEALVGLANPRMLYRRAAVV